MKLMTVLCVLVQVFSVFALFLKWIRKVVNKNTMYVKLLTNSDIIVHDLVRAYDLQDTEDRWQNVLTISGSCKRVISYIFYGDSTDEVSTRKVI